MKQYKEQCEALAKVGAIILVRDGFTQKGVPVYVTRKVTGCYGIKHGRNSVWGVEVDRLFADGANGVAYGMILGTNIDGEVKLSGLHYDVEIYGRLLTAEQQMMVLSDAETRLKMSDRQPRAHKIESFFNNMWRQEFSLDANNGHLPLCAQTEKEHRISDGSERGDHQHRNSIPPALLAFVLSVILVDDKKGDSPRKCEENLTHITMRYCDIVPCLMSRNQFDSMVKRGVIRRVSRGSKDVQGIYSVPV